MKAKEVLSLLKISRVTLWSYTKSGKIKTTKLDNGYYDYDRTSVLKLIKSDNRYNAIYARVSTNKQSKDLDNQVKRIQKYCKDKKTKNIKIFKDIASGIELERKEFTVLLDDVFNHKVDTIYITYKDRLSRLSFKLIELMFKRFGTNIVVITNSDNQNDSKDEYLEDIISLMHSLSTKVYSKRRKTI